MGSSLLIGGIVMWIVDAMNAAAEAAGPGAPEAAYTPGRWKP